MAYEEDIARWLQEAAELEAKEEETLPDGRKPQDVAEQKIEQCLRYDSTNADAFGGLGWIVCSFRWRSAGHETTQSYYS